jgi:hypothetical protein
MCGAASGAVAPNLLNREFSAAAPNQKRVTDVPCIDMLEGYPYLAESPNYGDNGLIRICCASSRSSTDFDLRL